MARSILAVLTFGLLAQPALASSYSPGTSSLPLDAPANPQGHHTVPCVGLLKEGGSLESLLPDDFDRSRVECGLFDVPLDWTRPRFTQDQLYYTKYRTADDAVREGTIFISPSYRPTASPLGPAFAEDSHIVSTAPKLHNGTGGKFDIVFWTARGQPGRARITTPGHNRCFDSTEEQASFYLQASKELGIEPEPSWGDRMEYLHDQTPDDARNWLQLQTDMLGACFSRQEATCCADTILRYVGTAATVRDVVAMADAFDGLGSAVNLWGTESGARVGAYLLKMFPERAGRVILDAPEDLQAYLRGYSYETWKTALQHAHETLSQFVETCVLSDGELEQDCSRYVHDEVLDDDNLGVMEMLLFSAVRNKYIGWRNAREVDLNNTQLTSAFKGPTKFGNHSFDAVLGLNRLQHVEHVDGLDLGMMPVFCGDQISEYSPESAAAGTHEIAERLRHDIGFALLFGASVFPSLNYLCHLWPVRAVERFNDFDFDLDLDSNSDVEDAEQAPLVQESAVAPLVIQYTANPLAPRRPLSHVVPGAHEHVAHEIVQMGLGLPSYKPKTCMGDVINDYLREGKLPDRTTCSGDASLDAHPTQDRNEAQPFTLAAGLELILAATTGLRTAPTSAWRKFMLDSRWACAGLVLAAVVVHAMVALHRRRTVRGPGRGSVRLEGEDTAVRNVPAATES